MIAHAVSYKFTVDKFDRMTEAGILREDDRLELIEGDIVCMPPIGSHHLWAVNRLTNAFAVLAVSRRALISVQNPIFVSDQSRPQPDVVLLPFSDTPDRDRLPAPADVLLLIEVADTSVDYDRLIKLPLYAAAGITEVWLVDLTEDSVEVYRKPSGDAYTEMVTHVRGDTISPLAFPDFVAKVEEIIG